METLGVSHFQETIEEFATPKRGSTRRKQTNYSISGPHEKIVWGEVWHAAYLFRNAIGIKPVEGREKDGLCWKGSCSADPKETLIDTIARRGVRLAIQNCLKLSQDGRPFNSWLNHTQLWFAPGRDLALDEVTFWSWGRPDELIGGRLSVDRTCSSWGANPSLKGNLSSASNVRYTKALENRDNSTCKTGKDNP